MYTCGELVLSFICISFCTHFRFSRRQLLLIPHLNCPSSSPACSGSRVGLCPVLVAVPCGSLRAVPLPGRPLPTAVCAVRVLQSGLRGSLLPECSHQPHPVQHNVLEIPGRSGTPLRPNRQPATTRPNSKHHEGGRLERLDGIHY